VLIVPLIHLRGVETQATIVALVPTTVDQQRFLSTEATLKDRFGRRRVSENHPALEQVDRLVSERPAELAVPISGLPGQVGPLLAVYEALFALRDYRVRAVDRRRDDLWIAHIEHAGKASNSIGGVQR
jgi:hypothetical protein